MTFRVSYTRDNPSERYTSLLAEYTQLHTQGAVAQGLTPEETFPGQSLPEHAPVIKRLVDKTSAKSLLDYGCGKGLQYEWRDLKMDDGSVLPSLLDYWGRPDIALFDPGYPPLSARPTKPADGVICTDVLEHCPEEDIPWIVDELFSLANKFIFANVASYPAAKSLPSGENVHCTVRPTVWWDGLVAGIASRFPGTHFRFVVEERGPTGLFGQKGKKTYNVIEGGPSGTG